MYSSNPNAQHGNSGSYNNVVEDMGYLHIYSPHSDGQSLSPAGSKVAPTVPPKPKKEQEGPGLYSNLPYEQPGRTGLQDYYAVNAPTHGNVGVASARLNRAVPNPSIGANLSVQENCDPMAPGKMGRTDSRVYHPDATPPSSHYTPPPPQPARSYTPTSKAVIRMGAPQPLYSNTNRPIMLQQQYGNHHLQQHNPQNQQQPLYSNQQQALYTNVGGGGASVQRRGHISQQQLYANVASRNGERPVQRRGDSDGHLRRWQHKRRSRLSTGTAYASYGADSDFPLPPPEALPAGEEFPPTPGSPVSSAYSELRRASGPQQARANHHQQQQQQQLGPGFGGYGGGAHAGYESFYEPISPRPSSQMSARSGGYATLYGGGTPGGRPQGGGSKEAEVDALTSLLVQSMESSGDPEFFGICARCGGKVVGEGSGCTAMEQVFHISCFDCVACHLQLQGQPFYAMDSKPYCEDCYMNTLEKCCVCTKPILKRILRATGKPYHPSCFTCVVCAKPLDGIPFTVDAANQIHCIEDFHKKFAPRCSVCKEPIMPEPGLDETVRVVALDRSFHVNCYKCEDCGLLLSSEAEGRGCYPLDGHVLCKSCNAARVQALSSSLHS